MGSKGASSSEPFAAHGTMRVFAIIPGEEIAVHCQFSPARTDSIARRERSVRAAEVTILRQINCLQRFLRWFILRFHCHKAVEPLNVMLLHPPRESDPVYIDYPDRRFGEESAPCVPTFRWCRGRSCQRIRASFHGPSRRSS